MRSPLVVMAFDAGAAAADRRSALETWLGAGARVVVLGAPREALRLRTPWSGLEAAAPGAVPSLGALLEAGVARSGGEPFLVAKPAARFQGDGPTLSGLVAQARGGAAVVGAGGARGWAAFGLDPRFVASEPLNAFPADSPWTDAALLFELAVRDIPIRRGPAGALLLWDAPVGPTALWRPGLDAVIDRLQTLSRQEGPVAALLAPLCRSLAAAQGDPAGRERLCAVLAAAMTDFAVGGHGEGAG